MMSLAPSEARWSEMARPIPREPPVTIAIRSWSLSGDGGGGCVAGVAFASAMDLYKIR